MRLVDPNAPNPVVLNAQSVLNVTPSPRTFQTYKPEDYFNYAGKKYGYITRYKEGFIPDFDNETYYADKQSGFDVTMAGIKQFGNLFANQFLNNFSQYGRDVQAIATTDLSRLWNTDMGERAAEVARAQSDLNPIFRTKEMAKFEMEQSTGKRGPFSAFTKFLPGSPGAGRFRSELLGQAGFSLGALGAYGVESLALGAFTGGPGGFANAALKAPKLARSIYSIFRTGDRLKDITTARRSVQASRSLKKLVNSAPTAIRRTNLAASESALEANMAALEFKEKELEGLGYMPTSEQLTGLQEDTEKVGDFTFGWNMPILLASNALFLGNIGNGKFLLPKTANLTNHLLSKGAKFMTYKQAAKDGLLTMGDRVRKAGLYLPLLNLQEGFEEGAQRVASETAKKFYSQTNSLYGETIKSQALIAGEEIHHTLTSAEGWNEIAAGIINGMGMSMSRAGINRALGGTRIGDKLGLMSAAKREEGLVSAADALNKGVAKYIQANVANGPIVRNASEQLEGAAGIAAEAGQGNEKAARDHRQDAKFSLFSLGRRYGVTDAIIDNTIEELRETLKNDPSLKLQLGENNDLEKLGYDLKQEAEVYNKKMDAAMTNLGAVRDRLTSDVAKAAHDNAVDVLVRLDMGADNAFSRSRNMMQELKTRAQESSDAAKIIEVLDAITNPESLVELTARVENSIEQREAANKGVEMTKKEREVFNLEMIKERTYLSTLTKLRDTFLTKDGKLRTDVTANEAGAAITNEFANYQGRFADKEFQTKLSDFLLLETEGATLRELYNNVQNPELFERSILKQFVKAATQQAKQQEKATEPVEDTKLTGKITEQEYQDAVANLPILLVTRVQNALQTIQEIDGKFTINGQEFATELDAVNAALATLSLQQEELDAVNRVIGAFVRKGKQDAAEQSEEQAEDSTQQTPGTPATQTTPTTPQTDEKPNTKQKIEERNKKFSVSRSTPRNIVTHFFDKALAKMYSVYEKYLYKFAGENVKKGIEKLKSRYSNNVTVVTIHLNDTLVPQSLQREGTEAITVFDNDIKTNGYVALREPKAGRIYVVVPGDKVQAAAVMADRLNLYVNPEIDGAFQPIRTDSIGGTIVDTNIPFNGSIESSRLEMAKLLIGDKVEIVIPANKLNTELVQQWVQEGSPQNRLNEIKNSIYINIVSNGQVVGVMRAGDFSMQTSQSSAAITRFRNKVVSDDVITNLTQGIATKSGTVSVSSKMNLLNINYNEDGTMNWTSLKDYIAAAKGNARIKIDVFIATSKDAITNSKGVVKYRAQLGRTSDFKVGAVYATVTVDGKRTVVVQAATDTAATFNINDLQDPNVGVDGIAEQVEIFLKPNEDPSISTRIGVDLSTFSTSQSVSVNTAKLKKEFTDKLNTEGDKIIAVTRTGNVVLLTEAKLEKQQVVGRDTSGRKRALALKELIGFRSVAAGVSISELMKANFEYETTSNKVDGRTSKGYTSEEVLAVLGQYLDPAQRAYLLAYQKTGGKIYFYNQRRLKYGGGYFAYGSNQVSSKASWEQGLDKGINYIAINIYKFTSLETSGESQEKTKDFLREVLTHEAVHALARYALTTTGQNDLITEEQKNRISEYRKELQDLREEVYKLWQKDKNRPSLSQANYVFKSGTSEELLTYALTNVTFAKWLDSQVIGKQEGDVKDTLWNRFKELIRKIVSEVFTENKTYLDRVGEIADKYLVLNDFSVVDLTKEFGPGSIVTEDSPSRIKLLSETEKEFLEFRENSTPFEQEQWIIENGQQGDSFELTGGTTIQINERTDTQLRTTRNGLVNIIGLEEPYNPDEVIDRRVLTDIIKRENNNIPLTVREHLIKVYNTVAYRTLKGQLSSVENTLQTTQEDYLLQAIKDNLSSKMGERVETVIAILSDTYLNSVIDKNRPTTMSELVAMSKGLSATEQEAILDTMGIGDYTVLWAYVTQADKVFNIKQLTNLRNIIERNFTTFESITNLNNVMVFDRQSPDGLNTRLRGARRYFQNFFNSISMAMPNLERLESLPQDSFRAVLNAFSTFMSASKNTTTELFNSLVELRTKLIDFGIDLDFGGLVYTRKGNNSNIINNSEFALMELDDVNMSNDFLRLIEQGATVGYVLSEENGGMVEFDFNDLKTMSPQNSIKFDVVSNFLAQFGMEMSPEYFQAYIQVNGDASVMFGRMDEQYKNFNSDRGQLDMETNTFEDYYGAPYSTVPAYESYINEKQAEDDLNEKTCK